MVSAFEMIWIRFLQSLAAGTDGDTQPLNDVQDAQAAELIAGAERWLNQIDRLAAPFLTYKSSGGDADIIGACLSLVYHVRYPTQAPDDMIGRVTRPFAGVMDVIKHLPVGE